MLIHTKQEQIDESNVTHYNSEYYHALVTEHMQSGDLQVTVDFGDAYTEMKPNLPKIEVVVDNNAKTVRTIISEHTLKGTLEFEGLGRQVLGLQVAFVHMQEIDKIVTKRLYKGC